MAGFELLRDVKKANQEAALEEDLLLHSGVNGEEFGRREGVPLEMWRALR